MGIGEHFLFYLFWCINKSKPGTMFIIEEPETYISIASQIHFANFLGKEIAKKGVSVILTTHSPYILSNIKNESIRIVSRMGNIVRVSTPDDNISAENILGVGNDNIGTIFVEDKVAEDFITIILEDKAPFILKKYTIDIAKGGSAEISKRLEFPKSDKIKYNFVGVYDGDMRESLETSSLQWPFCFLPGNTQLEENFRKFIHNQDNLSKFCAQIEKDENFVVAILSSIDGLDCHDWFIELKKKLSTDGRTLARAFYGLMKDSVFKIDEFIKELSESISPTDN